MTCLAVGSSEPISKSKSILKEVGVSHRVIADQKARPKSKNKRSDAFRFFALRGPRESGESTFPTIIMPVARVDILFALFDFSRTASWILRFHQHVSRSGRRFIISLGGDIGRIRFDSFIPLLLWPHYHCASADCIAVRH